MDPIHTLLVVLSALGLATQGGAAPRRVCYYEGWAPSRPAPHNVRPEDLDVHLCTHLNFAFASLDQTGIKLRPEDPDELHLYKPFTNLKHRNPHLKTLISVGGWDMGSKLFTKTVASQSNMHHFAQSAVTFLRAHGFDGLDIDWEYPAARGSPPGDKDHFATLLHIVHSVFVAEAGHTNRSRLLLTVAVGVEESRVQESYNVHAIARYVDFINLMTYDFHGEWENSANVHSALYSTNDFNIDRFAKYWVSQGAPKSKLVIGMPFYGRKFKLADPSSHAIGSATTDGGDMPYYEICQLIRTHHIHEHLLQTERVPYITYNGTWVGYDNVASLTEKAHYVTQHGYGGVMVWAIALDDTTGACGHGKYPLMHALAKGLAASAIVGRQL